MQCPVLFPATRQLKICCNPQILQGPKALPMLHLVSERGGSGLNADSLACHERDPVYFPPHSESWSESPELVDSLQRS